VTEPSLVPSSGIDAFSLRVRGGTVSVSSFSTISPLLQAVIQHHSETVTMK
jgi:hypothetical protein